MIQNGLVHLIQVGSIEEPGLHPAAERHDFVKEIGSGETFPKNTHSLNGNIGDNFLGVPHRLTS